MTKGAYYNENNREAAAWLRELIRRNLIAPGEVDERSIEDVIPADLTGFTQCHFFAGIGTWSYVLRRAGWPDDRRIWTGSCPCQPFSTAGKGAGFDDERHLWPAWAWLIRQCRPVDVVGEQVASRDGRAWLDSVYLDLEALDYTIGAVDLCAAGVGAPHIRQRIYFVAHARAQRVRDQGRAEDAGQTRGVEGEACERERVRDDAGHDGRVGAGILADAGRVEHQRRHGLRHADGGLAGTPPQDCGGGEGGRDEGGEREVDVVADGSAVGGLGDAEREGLQEREQQRRVSAGTLSASPGEVPVSRGGDGGMADAHGNGQRETGGSDGGTGVTEQRGGDGVVANAEVSGRGEEYQDSGRVAVGDREEGFTAGSGAGGSGDGMDDADSTRHQAEGEGSETETRDETRLRGSERGRTTDGLAESEAGGLQDGGRDGGSESGERRGWTDLERRGRRGPTIPGPTNGYWGDAIWIPCRDGKARPIEPGTFPLAHGAPARVVRLRGYGNGIVGPAAEEVIRAYIGYLNDINRFL